MRVNNGNAALVLSVSVDGSGRMIDRYDSKHGWTYQDLVDMFNVASDAVATKAAEINLAKIDNRNVVRMFDSRDSGE